MILFSGAVAAQADPSEQTISERVLHYRAIDSVVWAMPLLNFKQFRDGHRALGVGQNDIAYHTKIQDWKFQTATPNNTTPYVNFFWNIEDGPIVVEIPPSADGVGIFGTLMDAWQRPIDDVGAKGRDKGNGGKYVLVPEGYQGGLLPMSFTYRQRTNNGFAILRAIIPDASQENIDKAAEFAKRIKVYPLAQAANPPENNYIDGLINNKFKKLRILPSELCSDEEFLRRATLDIAGMLPTIDEYHTFLADPDPKKREKLVDGWVTIFLKGLNEMLERGGDHFADNKLTVADLKVAVLTGWLMSGELDHIPADIVQKNAPLLVKHAERVSADPVVKAYNASRT